MLDGLARQVVGALQERGWHLATAESCTGGGIAESITGVPGSSAVFDYGFVVYSNGAKQQLLGVSVDTLARHGAVSGETVAEMVRGALRVSAADIAVAVSGIAGPGGGSEEKPVGTVWLGWGLQGGALSVRRECFSGGREAVRRAAVEAALRGLLAACRT